MPDYNQPCPNCERRLSALMQYSYTPETGQQGTFVGWQCDYCGWYKWGELGGDGDEGIDPGDHSWLEEAQ